MKKVKFVFAVHNHQPVGNFGHVSEEAYKKAYLPLIEVLREHPWFKVNLHYTGPLLEWLEAEHPEFIDMLKGMCLSGQAEMMTGGLYEPILALLPDEDKVGQIRALTSAIERLFGQRPRGMWLAERVWEPHLPDAIARAGVEYVVVDDFHFKMAGLRDGELTGYFLTDEQHSSLKIFPGSERLRYTLPFKEPEVTIDYFRGLPDSDGGVLSAMADDGEKFGTWPGTNKWVYKDGWLKRFIKAVEENSGWLSTATFGEYLDSEPPRGRIFLPTSSYMEMGEWSLPSAAMADYDRFIAQIKDRPEYKDWRPFIKGGFFRNFLAKYPEAGIMHRRMLSVSSKVHAALDASGPSGKSGKAVRSGRPKKAAPPAGMLDELWRGQCNDAYWHGVFGGLYLPHLRDAVYRHLIRAEVAAEASLHSGGDAEKRLLVERLDLDADLVDEYMLSNDKVAIIAAPARGGCIYELDYRPAAFNMMNALARRMEPYHAKLAEADGGGEGGAATIHDRVSVKEEGLFAFLNYDLRDRASLVDHFLGPDAGLESFSRSKHREEGDFSLGRYEAVLRKSAKKAALRLSRRGHVSGVPVGLEKTVTLLPGEPGFEARYTLRNDGGEELNTTFGVEFNFSLMAGDAPDRYFEAPGHTLKRGNFGSSGELNGVRELRMVDEWLGYEAALSSDTGFILWRFPVETVSQSEAGFERVFQAACVMPLWKISLPPGGSWKVTLRLEITGRKK